jgi:hypothetical protein
MRDAFAAQAYSTRHRCILKNPNYMGFEKRIGFLRRFAYGNGSEWVQGMSSCDLIAESTM